MTWTRRSLIGVGALPGPGLVSCAQSVRKMDPVVYCSGGLCRSVPPALVVVVSVRFGTAVRLGGVETLLPGLILAVLQQLPASTSRTLQPMPQITTPTPRCDSLPPLRVGEACDLSCVVTVGVGCPNHWQLPLLLELLLGRIKIVLGAWVWHSHE